MRRHYEDDIIVLATVGLVIPLLFHAGMVTLSDGYIMMNIPDDATAWRDIRYWLLLASRQLL